MAAKQFRFGGLDNRHDPQEVGATGLVVSANVDGRNDLSIRRRQGYTATSLTGAALHSLWGSESGNYGYIADGATLKYLDTSLNPTTVLTMPSANAIKYVELPGTGVACITTSGIRFVNATAQLTFTTPSTLDSETSFTASNATWTGLCGAYFNGRLYVGVGTSLYFTRSGNVGYYDTRDYILPLGSAPTCVFAVDDGLWVGGAAKTVFLQGTAPSEFVFRESFDFGIYSGVKTPPADWGLESVAKAYAVLTTHGTMLLSASGQFVDPAKGAYYPPLGIGHTSVLRDENGYKQLLTCFTYSANSDTFINKSITVDNFEV